MLLVQYHIQYLLLFHESGVALGKFSSIYAKTTNLAQRYQLRQLFNLFLREPKNLTTGGVFSKKINPICRLFLYCSNAAKEFYFQSP